MYSSVRERRFLSPTAIEANSKVATRAIIAKNIPSKSTAISNEHIITHEE